MFIKTSNDEYINLEYSSYYIIDSEELINNGDSAFDVNLDQAIQDSLKKDGWLAVEQDDQAILLNPKKIDYISIERSSLEIELGFDKCDADYNLTIAFSSEQELNDFIKSIVKEDVLVNTEETTEDEVEDESIEEEVLEPNTVRVVNIRLEPSKPSFKMNQEKDKHAWVKPLLLATVVIFTLYFIINKT